MCERKHISHYKTEKRRRAVCDDGAKNLLITWDVIWGNPGVRLQNLYLKLSQLTYKNNAPLFMQLQLNYICI